MAKYPSFDSLSLAKTPGEGIKIDQGYGWCDMLGDLSMKAVGAGAPTLNVWNGGAAKVPFFNTGDTETVAFHIPHDYAPGTDLFLHLHWGHNGTAISGSLVVTFGVSYAKGHNQANFTAEIAPTLTVNTPDIATIPQYRHRIDEIQLSAASPSGTQLDTDDIEPDGIILVAVTLTTKPTITGGSTNLPALLYCDLHYQSTGVGTKAKVPNFYV